MRCAWNRRRAVLQAVQNAAGAPEKAADKAKNTRSACGKQEIRAEKPGRKASGRAGMRGECIF